MSFLPDFIVYGSHSLSLLTSGSSNFLPINLLTEKIVSLGLTIACLLATLPTTFLTGLATEGIVFSPSALWITLGFPPSITATAEFVVPKSIPTILLIYFLLLCPPKLQRRRIVQPLLGLALKLYYLNYTLF